MSNTVDAIFWKLPTADFDIVGGSIAQWRGPGQEPTAQQISDWVSEYILYNEKEKKLSDIDALKVEKSKTFTWGGNTWQSDHDSRDNIMGAATWASVAIQTNSPAVGDYLWHGGVENYCGITSDNLFVELDAYDTRSRGESMAKHLHAVNINARDLKNSLLSLYNSSPTPTIAEIAAFDITTGWPA